MTTSALRALPDDPVTVQAQPMVAATSAVSWPAVLAGAAAAAALSLILVILGTGLGLSSISPWADLGASAGTLGVSTIAWLMFTQVAAAGMGGYMAGRLRTRWSATHADEVYFRDTAHGFLAWGVATLITAALLSTAISSILGASVRAGASDVGGIATIATPAAVVAAGTGQGQTENGGYFVDLLFRKDASSGPTNPTSTAASVDEGTTRSTAEAGRILAAGALNGALEPQDIKYLGQMVALRTGLSQADADKRVADTIGRMQAKAKEAEARARDLADKSRKASAYTALWMFVSLLVGAFCASLAATYGGRRRDLF